MSLELKDGFCIISDTQRTSLLEFWRERNQKERVLLVQEIARRKPSFLLHLGDLVFNASSPSDWSQFDQLFSPIWQAGIPVLPIMGNHEYWGNPTRGHRNFFARFPQLKDRFWYHRKAGSLGLLCLDGNKEKMPTEKWKQQCLWFREQLQLMQDDTGLRGILVFIHHPPYTNSTVTKDEKHVKEDVVPPFLGTPKCMGLFSGHVHSYERFQRAGKLFSVVGGGGGPRVRLLQGKRRRHLDDLFSGGGLRPFHFLHLFETKKGLDVQVVGLKKGTSDFFIMDTYSMPWPK